MERKEKEGYETEAALHSSIALHPPQTDDSEQALRPLPNRRGLSCRSGFGGVIVQPFSPGSPKLPGNSIRLLVTSAPLPRTGKSLAEAKNEVKKLAGQRVRRRKGDRPLYPKGNCPVGVDFSAGACKMIDPCSIRTFSFVCRAPAQAPGSQRTPLDEVLPDQAHPSR
jgi:hypothetical protein